MWQTVYEIPHEIAGLPVFGLGWLLGAWLLFCAALVTMLVRRHGWTKETFSHLPVLAIVAIVIAVVIPAVAKDYAGKLPIRGYGTMMLIGVTSGVALAVYRGRQVGLHPDHIFSMAFWMFVLGILGARAFYVIEYWQEFTTKDDGSAVPFGTLIFNVLNITKGGLVVYGSLLGGLMGLLIYTRRNALPILAVADLVAPSMLLGLALGRIGCFLNGCCYGGVCDRSWGVHFPPESPPYHRQFVTGQLWGVTWEASETGRPQVKAVTPESLASRVGLKPGDVVVGASGVPVGSLPELQATLDHLRRVRKRVELETSDGQIHRFSLADLPASSSAIHPAQLYAAVDASVLLLFLIAAYPFRKRDGEILALMLGVHAVTRFLLEIIRTDEPGMLLGLSISQWIGIGILVVDAAFVAYLLRQPKGRLAFAPAGSLG